jgi:putative ABC transport system permease protein
LYNTFLKDAPVCQVLTNYVANGQTTSVRATSFGLIHSFEKNIIGIAAVAYTRSVDETTVTAGQKANSASGRYASPGFFRVIPRPFLFGSPERALSDPSSVVISSAFAEKLYGKDWPEKIREGDLRITGLKQFRIGGVFESFPENSTIQSDFFIPNVPDSNDNIGDYNYDTYVKLSQGADPMAVSRRINREAGKLSAASIYLQPFRDIYLYSHFSNGGPDGGRITYVRLFIMSAIFVLLMACINFMNLNMASSFRLTKEIGIRRLMGAERSILIRQFIRKAYILVFISIIAALLLLYFLLPAINDRLSENLTLPLQSAYFWAFLAGLFLVTGLLASVYPAIMLTSLKPVNIIRMKNDIRIGKIGIHKGLFALQFFASAFLIYSAFTVNRQVHFIRHKDLGYDKQNILGKKLSAEEKKKMPLIKSDLQTTTLFSGVTFSSSNLMAGGPMTGDVNWPGKAASDSMRFSVLFTDKDFIRTLKIPLEAGNFGDGTEAEVPVIVNRRAAQLMGGEATILGKVIDVWGTKGRVTGIAKDFNFNSLFNLLDPLIIANFPTDADYLFTRPTPGREKDALQYLATANRKFNPGKPLDYFWIEDSLDAMYKDEANVGILSVLFCAVSIIISLSGLFGLASFSIRQRIREMCIRKILGDSVSHIIYLIFRDLIRWIFVAAIVAIPLSYILLYNWLQRFAYRIDLSLFSFILPILGITLLIGLIILYYSARIGRINPVTILRED